MFARAASTLRNSGRTAFRQLRNNGQQQRRNMGGGAHWMETSKYHTLGGEVFGCIMWLWIFHRARNDLPVVLGMRHPWEHAHDSFDISGEADDDDQYDFANAPVLIMDEEEPEEEEDDDDDEDEEEEDDDEE